MKNFTLSNGQEVSIERWTNGHKEEVVTVHANGKKVVTTFANESLEETIETVEFEACAIEMKFRKELAMLVHDEK